MADPPDSQRARHGSTDDHGIYDDARTYYSSEERHNHTRFGPRTRTYSQVRPALVPTPSRPWLRSDPISEQSVQTI